MLKLNLNKLIAYLNMFLYYIHCFRSRNLLMWIDHRSQAYMARQSGSLFASWIVLSTTAKV